MEDAKTKNEDKEQEDESKLEQLLGERLLHGPFISII